MQKSSITNVNSWLMAIRLRSLGIPTMQVWVGASIAYFLQGQFQLVTALGAWIVAVLITIGTNLVNDAIDFQNGGDKTTRFGHRKAISAGLLSSSEVLKAGLLAFLVACFIPFVLGVHWLVCLLVAVSALCGYCYTGGPYPISYLGLSELFILLFYGWACILATFYVQTGTITLAAFLASTQMGLLAILPSALNNFRDVFEDAEIDKRTLAVRFGLTFARWEIAVLTFLPFLLNVAWLMYDLPLAFGLPLLLLPLAFLFVRKVWQTEPGPIFNRFFGLSVVIQFLFGLMLIIGMAIH